MQNPASEFGGDHWIPVPGWSPARWQPEENYVQILGTSEFVWPTTKKLYRSRSTAKQRAQLLESFGATVVIERSSKITWPEAGEEQPDTTARAGGRQIVIPIRKKTGATNFEALRRTLLERSTRRRSLIPKIKGMGSFN